MAAITDFIKYHYRHFNAAALVAAAEDYVKHLDSGGKMLVTIAGAMSTAEIGLSLAEMIRRDKVHAISCTGANLEEDSTLGNMYAGHCISGDVKNVHTVRTGIEYMTELADYYTTTSAKSSIGFFQIAGGIAGDFPICVVPMLHQDLQRTGVPLWGYFCQISDSTTSYGSYSGAVPNEKITWGKLGLDTPKHIIESDASIVAPLVFAYVLGW